MAMANLFYTILFQMAIKLMTYKYYCNAGNLPNTPAIFVFGDSTVDTGNNNYIPTLAKGNYKPYGINFHGGIPTGRFSDGKLIPDMIASTLGIKETVPPFLNPNLSDDELKKGACFASAAAGLDNQTNAVVGVINLLKQAEYFQDYIERLIKIVGQNDARRIVGEGLVIFSAGNVDFGANYYSRAPTGTLEFYQNFLLKNLQILIKRLYDLGCRKMMIGGLLPLGCLPEMITLSSPVLRTCVERMNSDAQVYNDKLIKLIPTLQQKLPGSILLYADLYTPLMELINNPQKHGFVETARGCCGTGLLELWILCNPLTPVCESPEKYVFWDTLHPSQSAYRYVTDYILKQTDLQI